MSYPVTRWSQPQPASNGAAVPLRFRVARSRPPVSLVPVGTTVTRASAGSSPHAVTFADKESGELDSGASHSKAFSQPGLCAYPCAIPSSVKGTIGGQ
jgi:plastocyanin